MEETVVQKDVKQVKEGIPNRNKDVKESEAQSDSERYTKPSEDGKDKEAIKVMIF